MDATAIQDYYRETLLDPDVLDVSAGMVFCTAKDPDYSATTMPGRSTAIVFSEAQAEDFEAFLEVVFEEVGLDRVVTYEISPDIFHSLYCRRHRDALDAH